MQYIIWKCNIDYFPIMSPPSIDVLNHIFSKEYHRHIVWCGIYMYVVILNRWHTLTETVCRRPLFFSSLSSKIMNFGQISSKMTQNQVSIYGNTPFHNLLAYIQSVLIGCQFLTKNAFTTF